MFVIILVSVLWVLSFVIVNGRFMDVMIGVCVVVLMFFFERFKVLVICVSEGVVSLFRGILVVNWVCLFIV